MNLFPKPDSEVDDAEMCQRLRSGTATQIGGRFQHGEALARILERLDRIEKMIEAKRK